MVPPSFFVFLHCLVQAPYEYTRDGNPTRTVLQKCAASLEGAKHGGWDGIGFVWTVFMQTF